MTVYVLVRSDYVAFDIVSLLTDPMLSKRDAALNADEFGSALLPWNNDDGVEWPWAEAVHHGITMFRYQIEAHEVTGDLVPA